MCFVLTHVDNRADVDRDHRAPVTHLTHHIDGQVVEKRPVHVQVAIENHGRHNSRKTATDTYGPPQWACEVCLDFCPSQVAGHTEERNPKVLDLNVLATHKFLDIVNENSIGKHGSHRQGKVIVPAGENLAGGLDHGLDIPAFCVPGREYT